MKATPQRVLIASKYFSEGFGGTPEASLLLAHILDKVGLACDVLSRHGLARDVQTLPGLPKAGNRDLSAQCLNIRSYGGLFLCGPWNRAFLGLCLRAKRAGIPISYAAKGGLAKADFTRLRDVKKIPYLLMIEIFFLMLADRIIFSSRFERDSCVVPAFFWRRKYVIVPEPFVPPPLQGAAAVRVDRPAVVLGFLAEIRALKGLRELVLAMALLESPAGGKPLRLRIVGAPRPGSEEYMRDVQAIVASKGLSDHVEWLGPLRGNDKRDAFYADLDAFICPSKSESFGFTPLEALWHGVPVAMGPCIGLRDFLPEDAPVLTFDGVSAPEIAAGLQILLQQLAELQKRAADWRGRVLQPLAGDVLAKRFAAVLLGDE